MKEKQAKVASQKPKTSAAPQPAKVIKMRLPWNYTWTGDGYIIR